MSAGNVEEAGMAVNNFRISIDLDKCIGSGNCVFNAKGVFEQDDEGVPLVADIDGQDRETIEFAALSCPVKAIRIDG
jgi:ferredoxin